MVVLAVTNSMKQVLLITLQACVLQQDAETGDTDQPNAYRRLKTSPVFCIFTTSKTHRFCVPVKMRLYNTHFDSLSAYRADSR